MDRLAVLKYNTNGYQSHNWSGKLPECAKKRTIWFSRTPLLIWVCVCVWQDKEDSRVERRGERQTLDSWLWTRVLPLLAVEQCYFCCHSPYKCWEVILLCPWVPHLIAWSWQTVAVVYIPSAIGNPIHILLDKVKTSSRTDLQDSFSPLLPLPSSVSQFRLQGHHSLSKLTQATWEWGSSSGFLTCQSSIFQNAFVPHWQRSFWGTLSPNFLSWTLFPSVSIMLFKLLPQVRIDIRDYYHCLFLETSIPKCPMAQKNLFHFKDFLRKRVLQLSLSTCSGTEQPSHPLPHFSLASVG